MVEDGDDIRVSVIRSEPVADTGEFSGDFIEHATHIAFKIALTANAINSLFISPP